MSTDLEILKDWMRGAVGDIPNASAPSALNTNLTQGLKRRSKTVLVQDAATAGTAVTETVAFRCEVPIKVIAVRFIPPVAIVADNTDFCTATASKRTGAGAATVVATATTKAASMNGPAAFVPGTLVNSVTAADLLLAAADVLTVLVSKGGSGKAICAATSYACFEIEYEEMV